MVSMAPAVPGTNWLADTRLVAGLRELGRHRELFMTLWVRDVKVRYRQSVLGLYWALLHPLAIALVLTVAFSIVVRVPVEGAPYFLFALSGLLVWNFFAHGVADATDSLVRHASLVGKVPFPKELLPLATVAARGVDLACALAIVAVLTAFLGNGLHLAALWLPALFLVLATFTAGLALLCAMANLYYRDVRQVVAVAIPLWMYLTPVIYPAEMVPDSLRAFLMLNPLAALVTATRDALVFGASPAWTGLVSAGAMSVGLLAAGYWLFKRHEPAFAEVV